MQGENEVRDIKEILNIVEGSVLWRPNFNTLAI